MDEIMPTKEDKRQYYRRFYQLHKEQEKERQRKLRVNDPEKHRIANRKWKLKNPDYATNYSRAHGHKPRIRRTKEEKCQYQNAYNHAHYISHPRQTIFTKEELKAHKRAWRKTPKGKECNRRQKRNHPEHSRKYRQTHSEQVKATIKKWQKQHPEYTKNWIKNHPERVREFFRRARNKRRELGNNLLWKPLVELESMDNHHINLNDMIRIPHRIHKSVYHNVRTGKGMREINNLTFKYINENCYIYPLTLYSPILTQR